MRMLFDPNRLTGRLFYCLIALLVAAAAAHAQAPATTQVEDVIYRPDGTPAAGTLLISWPAFTTADSRAVAAGSMRVTLGEGGTVSVRLVPNEGADPAGTHYKVVLQLDDGGMSEEYWSVPAAGPVTLATIRARIVPANVAASLASRSFVEYAVANPKQVGAIRHAAQFAGADAGAKIQAAIADLPATGGTVIAQFEGDHVGRFLADKPVRLVLGPLRLRSATCPVATIASSGVTIEGSGHYPSTTLKGTQLECTGDGDTVLVDAAASPVQGVVLRDLYLRGNPGAASGSCLHLQALADPLRYIADVSLENVEADSCKDDAYQLEAGQNGGGYIFHVRGWNLRAVTGVGRDGLRAVGRVSQVYLAGPVLHGGAAGTAFNFIGSAGGSAPECLGITLDAPSAGGGDTAFRFRDCEAWAVLDAWSESVTGTQVKIEGARRFRIEGGRWLQAGSSKGLTFAAGGIVAENQHASINVPGWIDSSSATPLEYLGGTVNNIRLGSHAGGAFTPADVTGSPYYANGVGFRFENHNQTFTGYARFDVGGTSADTALRLAESGGATPNKYLRVNGGEFQVVNSAFSASILRLTDAGVLQASVMNPSTGFRVNGSAPAGQVLRGNGTNFVATQLAYADLSGLPVLPQNTAASGSQFLTAYDSATGTFAKAQPAVADLSDSSALPRVLDRSTATVDVVNTTAETTLYSVSVPGGTLATSKAVCVSLGGDYLNSSGAGRSFILSIKYGGTVLYRDTSASFGADANRRPYDLDFCVAAKGATNAQYLYGGLKLAPAGAATVGQGELGAAGAAYAFSNSVAVDSTQAQTLEVTVQHSTSHANLSFRKWYALAEVR